MTGVVKSNRCGTCRKRKVKCDEAKPICGPCQKGGRICEDPISKVKFTKPKEIPGQHARRVSPNGQSGARLEPCSNIAILRSTAMKDGASFQTMRVARPKRPFNQTAAEDTTLVARPPSPSPLESLQIALLHTFSSSNPGLRLSSLAVYIQDIPRRLGYSAALDDAVLCLAHCHSIISRGGDLPASLTQAKLYYKALQSLQAALLDSVESCSDNTLCAVTILGQIELLGGGEAGPSGNKFIQHAGGATRLVKARGPTTFQSDFAKILLKCVRGNAMVDALLRGIDCFLDQPEWWDVSNSLPLDSLAWQAGEELQRLHVSMPTMLRHMREVYEGSDQADANAVLKHAQRLRRSIQGCLEFVTESLENGVDVIEVPSCQGDPFVPIVYEYSSRIVAGVCVEYWAMSLILDTIIARLLPPNAPPSAAEILNNRCLRHRSQIMMSVEFGERFWPLACNFVCSPLIFSYHGATSEERQWIQGKLFILGRHVPGIKRAWSEIGLQVAGRFFYGEPVIIVPDDEKMNCYHETWRENARRIGKETISDELVEKIINGL